MTSKRRSCTGSPLSSLLLGVEPHKILIRAPFLSPFTPFFSDPPELSISTLFSRPPSSEPSPHLVFCRFQRAADFPNGATPVLCSPHSGWIVSDLIWQTMDTLRGQNPPLGRTTSPVGHPVKIVQELAPCDFIATVFLCRPPRTDRISRFGDDKVNSRDSDSIFLHSIGICGCWLDYEALLVPIAICDCEGEKGDLTSSGDLMARD